MIEIILPSLLSEIRGAREINSSRKDEDWYIYNSLPHDYEAFFRQVLKGKHFLDFLQEKEMPLVIDLMSTSTMVSSLLEDLPQNTKSAISVSLTDDRNYETRVRDHQLGTVHIAGDLTSVNTWREIDKTLKDRKADLIVTRGAGAVTGASTIPGLPIFYGYALSKMWEMLSCDHGRIFAQFSPLYSFGYLRNVFDEWVEILKQQGVEMSSNIGLHKADDSVPNNALALTRTPDSPSKLPLLKRVPCRIFSTNSC